MSQKHNENPKTKKPIAMSLFSLCTGILFILALLFASRMIISYPLSPDSYLHMGIGKYIVTTQSIPDHEAISYRSVGPVTEWITHGWLGDTLLYLTTSYAPEPGAIVLALLLLVLCLFIQYKIFSLMQTPLSLRLLLMALTLFIVPIYWRLSPYLLLAPLFLSVCYILIAFSMTGKKRPLLFLPLITLLWANIYGGYIFLLTYILLSYLIYIFTIKFFQKSSVTRSKKYFVLALLLCLPASLVNPQGLKIWLYGYSFYEIIQFKQAFNSLPGYLTLINQTFLYENVSSVPYTIAIISVILLFGAVFFAFIQRKKKSFVTAYPYLLPLLLLVVFPILYIRFIPLIFFILTPLMAGVLTYSMTENKKWTTRILLAVTILAIPFFLAYLLTPYKIIRINPPVVQRSIITDYNLPPNILTTPQYTGYIFYHTQQKLNIDLYDDIFDESETINLLIHGDLIDARHLTQLLTEKLSSTVLVGKETGNFARSLNSMLQKDWALIYYDRDGFLFVKRDIPGTEFVKKNEIRHVNLASNLGVDREFIPEATTEHEKLIKKYPNNSLAIGQLATLYRIQKKPEKAERILHTIPQASWDYALYTEMGRTYASMGRCEEAETSFLAALDDRNEQNYSRAVLDLAIVYAGCLHDGDRAKHYFDRYLSYVLPQSEKEKTRKLAEDFGIQLDE